VLVDLDLDRYTGPLGRRRPGLNLERGHAAAVPDAAERQT